MDEFDVLYLEIIRDNPEERISHANKLKAELEKINTKAGEILEEEKKQYLQTRTKCLTELAKLFGLDAEQVLQEFNRQKQYIFPGSNDPDKCRAVRMFEFNQLMDIFETTLSLAYTKDNLQKKKEKLCLEWTVLSS